MSMTFTSPPFRNPFSVRWTREDCAKLESDGYLNHRYELVEGDIIDKMGQNIPHRIAVSRLTGWLYRIFNEDYVQSQAAIDVAPEDNPTSEPEPDAAVLTVPFQTLVQQEQRNPTAEQVCLVVEVSDTTLQYDLSVKAALYARAGIAEYWVIDLNARAIHIHRHPQVGQYSSVIIHPERDTVSCLASPTLTVSVAALLP